MAIVFFFKNKEWAYEFCLIPLILPHAPFGQAVTSDDLEGRGQSWYAIDIFACQVHLPERFMKSSY
jgi:hypothetical protein